MTKFVIQNRKGNQTTFANPEDVSHTLMVNGNITNVPFPGGKGGKYAYVRNTVSVTRRFSVDADCDTCKHKVPCTVRIDFNAAQAMSQESVDSFLKTVFEPAVAAARQQLSGGAARGFRPNVDVDTQAA